CEHRRGRERGVGGVPAALERPQRGGRREGLARRDHPVCRDGGRAAEREPVTAQSVTSAAVPTIPANRGTASSTLSRAQNAMSSASPGGPYVRAVDRSYASGDARATSAAAIAASDGAAWSRATIW